MEKLRIQLRAVFYREGAYWVAHCLEMDVMGHGSTKKAAFKSMNDAILLQLSQSIRYNNRANIFQPADAKFFEMYAAGRNTAIGEFTLVTEKPVPADRAAGVTVEDFEAREYQGELAVC